MSVETLKGEDYEVTYNDVTKVFSFSGSMRLRNSEEYQPISDLLQKAYEDVEAFGIFLMDFSELKFLNSSGINIVSRFVIYARKSNKARLHVKGKQDMYWQKKSLGNLSRLWPETTIEIK